jgi:hypothetical protein
MNEIDFQFDESVQQALEKWPNVPNCFGWISLDRRGHWLIKNEVITHERAQQFLSRNYTCDQHGRWFIQNGPQRVFCELAITPLVCSLNPDLSLTSHTGSSCHPLSGLVLDDQGNLLLRTKNGLGLLDDRDLTKFFDAVTENSGAKSASLDFEYARRQNTLGEAVTIDFNGSSLPVFAEQQEQLESIYGFVCKPEPLESEV